MADSADLRKEIVALVAAIADLPVEKVSEDATLESLGIDSLNGLRIVAAVEKRFGIDLPEEAIAAIRSMPDIFALAESRRGSG